MNYYQYILSLPLPYLLLAITGIVLFIRLFTEITFILALRNKKKSAAKTPEFPVSIIVCARNESKNLVKNIPLLCKQKYPDFEVIVVNDASTDNSERTIRDLETRYKNLRHTTIPKDPDFDHGKKLALTVGIKAAKHEHLLLTDADCWPVSNEWLSGMARKMSEKKIVLGYGGFHKEKALLNRLIRYDSLLIAKNYLGMARLGIPYMGVGRNLAYHRSVYEEAGGFSDHYHLSTGDDDLLINQMAKKSNTTVSLDPKTFTRSFAKKKFRFWKLQKKRHLKAGSRYRTGHKIILGFEWLIRTLTWPLLILVNFFCTDFIPYVSLGSIFYAILILIIWKFYLNKFHEKGFLLLVPFFEIIISILPLVYLIQDFIKKEQARWN